MFKKFLAIARQAYNPKNNLVFDKATLHPVIQWLDDYIKKIKDRLITVANNNTGNISTDRKTKMKKQKWEEKQQYGSFK